MSAHKLLRYLVAVLLSIVFLKTVSESLTKFMEKRIGESHGTKRAAEMFFPSLAIVPIYDVSYTLPRVKGTMNLTEYYENRVPIADKILMMQQSFESENG